MSHAIEAPLATFREVLGIDERHIKMMAIMPFSYLFNMHGCIPRHQDLPFKAIDVCTDTLQIELRVKPVKGVLLKIVQVRVVLIWHKRFAERVRFEFESLVATFGVAHPKLRNFCMKGLSCTPGCPRNKNICCRPVHEQPEVWFWPLPFGTRMEYITSKEAAVTCVHIDCYQLLVRSYIKMQLCLIT
jgi:hypothetical protein